MEAIYWLIFFLVLMGIELITLGLTTIWFAVGALVAFLAALFSFGLWVQMGVFLVVSLMMLLFTRPVAARYLNRKTVKTNVESLVGRKGQVTETIDNLQATGAVTLDGMTWTARAVREDQTIPQGSLVKVIHIQGVKLMVEMCEEAKI